MKAIHEVNKSHRWKAGHRPNRCTAWVEETKPERVKDLKKIILNGFKPKKPHVSKRWDPNAKKWRTVSEPVQWPDQYIHHALVQVLQPVFMRGMDYYCCGSIKGRGPHQAKKSIESWVRKDRKGTKYCFTADIRHFYDSLTEETVINRMRALIKDHRTMDLIQRIIRDGVTIGAYTSQWFANTVLQPMDRLIRNSGLCTHYVRYMDNLTIFGSNKRKLRQLKALVENWLNEHGLEMKGDWQIFRVIGEEKTKGLEQPRNGVTRPKGRTPCAVGYRYGRNFTLIRKHSLLRIKRALTRYEKRKRLGKKIPPKLAAGLLSRLGLILHCNNCNLYRMLFKGNRVTRELKQIVRTNKRKEELTWNTYLEQRRIKRSSKLKEAYTAT